VVASFHAVDRRDWAGTRRCLTDTVAVDYTSLFEGSAEQLAADDLLTRWRALLRILPLLRRRHPRRSDDPSDRGAGDRPPTTHPQAVGRGTR
jgi:hypothetical protein